MKNNYSETYPSMLQVSSSGHPGKYREIFHVLTGKEDQIYALAKKQYFAGDTIGYYQAGNEFLHTENFILVDKHRRIRGVYNGTLSLEMERLMEDINTLKKEE